jgi:hypothetical protein
MSEDHEVGWHLHPDHGGQGYATEAKGRPVGVAKQVSNQELHRISRLCDVGDAAHLVLNFGEYRHDALSGDADRPGLHPLAGAHPQAPPVRAAAIQIVRAAAIQIVGGPSPTPVTIAPAGSGVHFVSHHCSNWLVP